MAKAKKTSIEESKNEALETALKRFDDSWDYQEDNWHDRWDRDNTLYANERRTRSYEGLADTFVPMTFPMIETMVTALASGTLRFDFTSGDPLKDPDTRALNGLIDEYWERDQWDLKGEESIREMLVTGMAGGMLSWDIDKPHWDVYAMRDLIVDPTIVSPADLQQSGAYAGRRYYVRKGALKDFEKVDVDPNSETYGELIPRFNLPEETSEATNKKAGEESDRQLKEKMFAGSTLKQAADDQDEIIEIWDVDRVVTIMNRKHVIEDVVNPYKQRHQDLLTQQYMAEFIESLQGIDAASTLEIAARRVEQQAKLEAKGLVPFFFFRNYRRASLFYAKSEIDAIAKHQELLNDLTNLETDMLIKTSSPQRELDPDFEDWIDLINSDPDTVYPFRPGSLQYIMPPPMNSNLFANRQNIKNEMREATAIDQVRKGVQNQREATATEVRGQLASSGERIDSKARILEKDAFYWFATILFRQIQLYVTEPMVVKVSGPATRGKESGVYRGKQLPPGTAMYDPADYDSDFVPTISLEVDSQAKKEESRERALTEFQILIQDPTNNIAEVKKVYYPKMFELDKADLDAILTPPAQPAGSAAMGALPMGGEAQPGMPVEIPA